jgi:hypothetical protein
MEIKVQQVIVPIGSSIGFVIGEPVNDSTKVVVAAGDPRALVTIAEAMVEGEVVADIPNWSIIRVYETP